MYNLFMGILKSLKMTMVLLSDNFKQPIHMNIMRSERLYLRDHLITKNKIQ